MERKIRVKETVEAWSGYELDGKLTDIIDKLKKVITDNPNLFDFEIDVENESGWYGESSTNITITAYRWETDE